MKTFYFALFVAVFSLSGCGEENFDPAGACVTCVTTAAQPETITACANGDGTITLTENGVETVTSENTLADFQQSQEGDPAEPGAVCN